MSKAIPPNVEKFPVAKQRRLDELLDKNSEGAISPQEKLKLEQLVAEAEQLLVANAKRLAAFARKKAGQPALSAIPVTVWVQPETSEH